MWSVSAPLQLLCCANLVRGSVSVSLSGNFAQCPSPATLLYESCRRVCVCAVSLSVDCCASLVGGCALLPSGFPW